MRDVHPEAEGVLDRLVEDQRALLGDDLVGTYLFGSAATGDFEPGVSDVDTVAVLRGDPTARQLSDLDALHRAIVEDAPAWVDRVEAVYLSVTALSAFRTRTSPAARISPGEPFHAIEVDRTWVLDWFQLREVGIALHGPPAVSLVPAIPREEYVDAVRRHLLDPGWLDGLEKEGNQAYAVLTMCRGLRTSRTGEHVSKPEAARWASEVLPTHAALIAEALLWRRRARTAPATDGAGTRAEVRAFVMEVQHLLA